MSRDLQAVTKIHEIINWLATNADQVDINAIGIKLNEIAIWSANFADQVADAHEAMNNLEHEYDLHILEYVKEHGSERGMGVKAERDAEIKYSAKHKEFIEYKNLYKRLDLKLKSIDRIIDTHKQRVSGLKMIEMKNV